MIHLRLSKLPIHLIANPLQDLLSKFVYSESIKSVRDHIDDLTHYLFDNLDEQIVEQYFQQAKLPYIKTANKAIKVCCDYRFEKGKISVQRGMNASIQRVLAEHILYNHLDKIVSSQEFSDTINHIFQSGTPYKLLNEILDEID